MACVAARALCNSSRASCFSSSVIALAIFPSRKSHAFFDKTQFFHWLLHLKEHLYALASVKGLKCLSGLFQAKLPGNQRLRNDLLVLHPADRPLVPLRRSRQIATH